MDEWKKYKLGDVVQLINGRAYSQHELFDEGKYKIVRVGNLSGGDRWFYSDMELSEEKYCEEGDLLYAWACNFGPYIWKGNKTIYHYHIWKLIEDKDFVDKLFLFHYLKFLTPYWLGNVHGSVMVHITKGTMEKFIISLPPLTIQKRIAAILQSLDDKIEVNKRINDNLEQQGQALFEEYVMNPNMPRTQLLSDYALINPTRTIAKGRAARCIDMSSLPTKGTFPSDWTFKEYNGGMKFQNGDTIMARITPCLENGKTAYINFLDENEVAFGSTEYIVLSAHEGFCSELLYFLARYDDFVSYAVSHMNGSSGRQRVSGNDIANYVMPEITNETMDVISKSCMELWKLLRTTPLNPVDLQKYAILFYLA